MIRLLFIIPTLDRSGAEKQLTLLATRLPRDEFQVEVCALTRGGPYETDLRAAGIPVHVLNKRLKVDPVAAWKLRQLITRGQFDIVHTWLFAANWHGRAMARLCGVPILVASERCADHWKGFAELLLDRWLAPHTAAIVVNSNAVLQFYESKGIDASKMVVIPNGIAVEPPPAIDRAALLAEFDVPADARVLGVIGRLWPQKRVRDAIWATEVLRNVQKNLYLLVVGDGPDRAALEDYARKAVLGDRVRFLGPRNDVARLLTAMDVLLLPSEFEGMSNSAMEAMAAGVPVVASNIPGNDELIVDGQSGFLVPVGDTKAICMCVNRLLDDDVLRSRISDAARRRVHECFSAEHMVATHVSMYRDLAKKLSIAQDSR